MPARKSDSGDAGKFTLIAVTAFPGGRFLETKRFQLTSRSEAYEVCDRLQGEFDEDCDPVRVYIVDDEGIPLRAGLAAMAPPNYFFEANERRPRYLRRVVRQ